MGIYLSHTLYVVLSLSGSSVRPLWMKAQQVNTSEKYEHFVKLFMGQCKQWGKWRCSVLTIYVLYFITPQRIWNRVSCLWCMRQTSDTEWVVARHGAVESRPVTGDGTVVSDLHPLCYLHRFLSQTPLLSDTICCSYSTQGNTPGIFMANVRSMINKHQTVVWKNNSINYIFVQQLCAVCNTVVPSYCTYCTIPHHNIWVVCRKCSLLLYWSCDCEYGTWSCVNV